MDLIISVLIGWAIGKVIFRIVMGEKRGKVLMNKPIREPCKSCRYFNYCLERRGTNCSHYEKRETQTTSSS